jgi:hypothetical protein
MILQKLVDMIDMGRIAIGKDYKEMRICELGDQRMKWHPLQTGKRYLIEEKGVAEHISIDINAKNGAIPLDLTKPIDKWNNYFDMVTNFGTTEHVDNQFEVFRNIHNFTKVGGVMIHTVPIVGGWTRHCNIHYEAWAFKEIAKSMNYKVVYADNRLVDGRWKDQKEIDKTLVCAILLKSDDGAFMEENQFNTNGDIKHG